MTLNEFALYVVHGLTIGAPYGLVAIAISLVYRATHVVNFPTGSITAVAALLGGSTLAVQAKLPIVIALIVAMLVAGALSGAVSFALLPPRRLGVARQGLGWVIAAVAASIVISELAGLIWGTDQVAVGSIVNEGVVVVAGVTMRIPAIAVLVGALVVAIALDAVLRHTRWGLFVRAAGGDPVGVAVSRIRVRRVYLEVFFIAGAIAGATGILLGPLSPPSASIGFALTIQGFIAAAIGGLGNVRGALVGGLLLGLLEAFGGSLLGAQWEAAIALAVLMFVLLVSPTGIVRVRRGRAI